MRAEDLRKLLDRRPFIPIRLHFSDGSAIDIRHPEMALLSRSTVDIGIPGRAKDRIADRIEYCTLIHIVRVENINGEPSKANPNPP